MVVNKFDPEGLTNTQGLKILRNEGTAFALQMALKRLVPSPVADITVVYSMLQFPATYTDA